MENVKVGTLIWYMINGKIHSAPIFTKMTVENLHDDWNGTAKQKSLFTPFGKAGTFYATCHGIIDINSVYMSRELLVESLLKAA